MMVTLHTRITTNTPRADPSITPSDMRSLPFAIMPQNTKENTPMLKTAQAVTVLEDLVGIFMSVWLNSCLHRGASNTIRLSSLAFTKSSSVCLYLNRITQADTIVYARRVPIDMKSIRTLKSNTAAITAKTKPEKSVAAKGVW